MVFLSKKQAENVTLSPSTNSEEIQGQLVFKLNSDSSLTLYNKFWTTNWNVNWWANILKVHNFIVITNNHSEVWTEIIATEKYIGNMEQSHSLAQWIIVFFSVWNWENVFENSWSQFYFAVRISTISNMFVPIFGPLVTFEHSMNRRCLKTSGNHYPWKPPSFNQISSYILSCGCQRHFDEKTEGFVIVIFVFDLRQM